MDPYSGTARLVIYGLLVLAVLGAFARWRYVEGELADARGEVARLEEDAQARAKNAELAAALTAKWRERDAKRAVSVSAARKEVYDAKKPVPEVCRDALQPLDRALDGLRSLRAERGAAPARPRVLGRPAIASHG